MGFANENRKSYPIFNVSKGTQTSHKLSFFLFSNVLFFVFA